MDILQCNALLDHQHHRVVAQIGDLVDGLGLILGFGGDDDLGAFLADLL